MGIVTIEMLDNYKIISSVYNKNKQKLDYDTFNWFTVSYTKIKTAPLNFFEFLFGAIVDFYLSLQQV